MVKFISEEGFYPQWAQGEGRWVQQRVLVRTLTSPFALLPPPLEVSKSLVWVPPKGRLLGLRKISSQAEAHRASAELNQIPFRCPGCGWKGIGSKLVCIGDKPAHWVLECPECFTPVEADLRGLDAEVIIEQWHRLGRPVLENPGAAPDIVSIKPINDLRDWIESFEPMANELAYVGQQLWPNFTSFIMEARQLESYHRRNEETFRELVNGAIYFGSADKRLYALDALTGKLKWSYKTKDYIYSSPAVANGIVYFGSWDKKLHALDGVTGKSKWSYETGDCINSSPVVANVMVYFGSWDKKFYALNALTGELKWVYETGGRILCSPALNTTTVYFGSEDGNWYALDANYGKVKWSFKRELANADDAEFGYCCPGVANDIVYFLSSDEKLYALDAETGKLLWIYYEQKTYEEDSLGGLSHNTIGESGIIYCSGASIEVCALDGKTGEFVWTYENPELLRPSLGGLMAVANGLVYAGGSDAVVALEAETGRVVWRHDNEDISFACGALSVVGRIVCCVAENHIFALDALTGDYKWSYNTSQEITTSPAIVLST